MSSQPLKYDVSSSWSVSCRPTLLFVVAFALNVTPHEIVHAITSYLLGFNSTVFQMWLNPDSAEATPRQLAIIAVSGPLFSLAVGAVCWMLYQRRFRDRPSGLTFLMIAMVGMYSFSVPLSARLLEETSAPLSDFSIFECHSVIWRRQSVSYSCHLLCSTWEKNCCGGRLANSVARKLSLARHLQLGCLELFYSCW